MRRCLLLFISEIKFRFGKAQTADDFTFPREFRVRASLDSGRVYRSRAIRNPGRMHIPGDFKFGRVQIPGEFTFRASLNPGRVQFRASADPGRIQIRASSDPGEFGSGRIRIRANSDSGRIQILPLAVCLNGLVLRPALRFV